MVHLTVAQMMEKTKKRPKSGVGAVLTGGRGARSDVYRRKTNTEESICKHCMCLFSAKL